MNAQLQAKTEEAQFSQEKQSALNVEVGTLRQSCSQLEKAMMELQGDLESKNASLASLGNDLKVAEDQYGRLMVKVEEMQNAVASRDNTGETASNRCNVLGNIITAGLLMCFCSPRFTSTDGGSSNPASAGPAGAQHPAEPTEDLPG